MYVHLDRHPPPPILKGYRQWAYFFKAKWVRAEQWANDTLCLVQTVHNSESNGEKKSLIAPLIPATIIHLYALYYFIFPTYLKQNNSLKQYFQSEMSTI